MTLLALAVAVPFSVEVCEFVYTADRELEGVSVAGSFNAWNKDADPMVREGQKWVLRKSLPFGEYQYKFVLNGEEWIADPLAPTVNDGNGNSNSLVVHMPADTKSPAIAGDGVIARSLLKHEPRGRHLSIDGDDWVLRVETRPNDVESVEVVFAGEKAVPLEPFGRFGLTQTYQARWPHRGVPMDYRIRIRDGATTVELPTSANTGSGDVVGFRVDPAKVAGLQVPDWVERTVFYQIFPDRFENGDRSNDPATVAAWDAEPTFTNLKGGDLAGVRKRIPYLKSLGVSGVYFNPLFVSDTNHGYRTTDYYRIDPRLGTNDQFRTLTSELRSGGMRVVLDGVFNHSGPDFFAFADLLKNQQASRYRDWYFVKKFPVEVRGNDVPYEGWAGFADLPKLNMSNAEPQDYFLDVASHWIKETGINGWRLDVANEVTPDFWKKFRSHVKAEDPQSWILGEHWEDSTAWLGGDQWDAAMNYPFRNAVLDHIARGKTDGPGFVQDLLGVYALYPPAVSRNMMNLLGSHDTPRIRTECGGRDDLARLAATVLLTWPGTPCIYYGDELGMEGGRDPQNRRGMRWDIATDQNATLRHYRSLVAARNASPALQTGEPVSLLSTDRSIAAYARASKDDLAVVLLNRTDQARPFSTVLPRRLAALANGRRFQDVLSDLAVTPLDGRMVVTVPPRSGVVLLPRPPQGQTDFSIESFQSPLVTMQ